MIKCLIVEDNIKAAEIAESLLTKYFSEIEITGKANSLKQAYQLLSQELPDLLILDVNLPDGTIFDLLSKIDVGKTRLIFTTAHSKYASEVFKFSALDFLLKPYLPEDFKKAVSAFLESIEHAQHHKQLEAFFHNHNTSSSAEKKIVLRSKDRIDIVFLKDIIRAEADDNYSKFVLADKRSILISKPLKEFDMILSSDNFLRVHQSHLVNLDHINSFNKKDMTLSLSFEDIEIPVSQSRKAQLLDYFNQL